MRLADWDYFRMKYCECHLLRIGSRVRGGCLVLPTSSVGCPPRSGSSIGAWPPQ